MRGDAAIKDRLSQIREDKKDAKARLDEAVEKREKVKEELAGAEINGKFMDSAEYKKAEAAVAEAGAIEDELNDYSQAEKTLLAILSGKSSQGGNLPGVAGVQGAIIQNAHDMIAATPSFHEAKQAGLFQSRNSHFGTIDFGEMVSRDNVGSFLSPRQAAYLPGAPAGPVQTTTFGQFGIPPDNRGIIPPYLRPLTLLDILPTGTTDSNIVEYVQVTGLPEGAAETEELAIKPELGMATQDASAPVRTIAGWIKLARQALDDVAGLASMVNMLLPYEVNRRVEAQILAGDGEGQNLLGILNTTGIGEVAVVTGANAADQILRAMTVVHLSGSQPNFVAVNPLTWQNLLLLRTNTGGAETGLYLLGGPGSMPAASIWGMVLTPSLIVDQHAPLVGDSMGAQLLVKEGVNLRTSDSDQDDFIRNRVTVLSETRVALPVWRPTAFCVANVDPAM